MSNNKLQHVVNGLNKHGYLATRTEPKYGLNNWFDIRYNGYIVGRLAQLGSNELNEIMDQTGVDWQSTFN
jgi:hypothetical protein